MQSNDSMSMDYVEAEHKSKQEIQTIILSPLPSPVCMKPQSAELTLKLHKHHTVCLGSTKILRLCWVLRQVKLLSRFDLKSGPRH